MMKRSVVAALVASIAALSSGAQARESAYRAELGARSRASGLGAKTVELLRRLPGRGNAEVASLVTSRLRAPAGVLRLAEGSERQNVDGGRLQVTSTSGWSIRVREDGTRVEFDNRGYLEQAAAGKVAVKDRISHEELEQIGKSFISKTLGGLVTTKAGEELVPLKSEYEVHGGGEGAGPKQYENVVANTIVFGRTVNGIAVLGAGSKIAVTFANDRTPVAFSYDWPEYAALGERQDVHDMSVINERMSALASMRFGASEVEVKRFECGYFDRGAKRKRDVAAPIQAACVVHYVGRRQVQEVAADRAAPESGAVVTAISDAIPVGVHVLEDAAWPHAQALRKHGDVCAVSEISEALLPDQSPR
ncbi:hypothetical protein WMF28_31585 [Sorangium sp. So ce590]|uniref:hypothetical protein n=1 Tax=Sorangium sp. So ce590 TaxID=3133317 RepID=UPI003F5EF101